VCVRGGGGGGGREGCVCLLLELLEAFQQGKAHVAIVVDTVGGEGGREGGREG